MGKGARHWSLLEGHRQAARAGNLASAGGQNGYNSRGASGGRTVFQLRTTPHPAARESSMDNHSSNAEQDAEFVRNFALVLLLLAAIGIVIYFLANKVNAGYQATLNTSNAVAERVAPVGQVNTSGATVATGGDAEKAAALAATPAAATAAAAPADKGKATYDAGCFACHAVGAGGAPKVGDAAAWADRIAQGNDTLYAHAINGYQGKAGMMPPKGGRPDLADDDVKAAVDYMVTNSK